MMDSGAEVAFLSLAYNHEDFIVEHLESIKFLVESYGSNFNCKLIINDDCSSDETVEIVDAWLNKNQTLFQTVVKLYNKTNIGTCASILNMLEHVKTPYFKLTACDDVYSFENIFEHMSLEDGVAILSGYPLMLIDGELSLNKKDICSIVASNVIYNDSPMLNRFKFLSSNNAPNIIYNHLTDVRVLSFLNKFDVVEDWPIQISIAENFPASKYKQVDKVFVYYRRTLGSAYLVAGQRFYDDKCRVYSYLMQKEKKVLDRYILKSRLICFKANKIFFNKVLNLAFYKFLISVARRLLGIITICRRLDLKVKKHQGHYALIQKRATAYMNSWDAKNG